LSEVDALVVVEGVDSDSELSRRRFLVVVTRDLDICTEIERYDNFVGKMKDEVITDAFLVEDNDERPPTLLIF
jgi:hypothetical protein